MPRNISRKHSSPADDQYDSRQNSPEVREGNPEWRHFLKRRALGFTLDGKIKGMLSRYVDGKEPRLYKGPRAPTLNDFAYTEKVVFE